ncbi:MAG: HipA domain-containing protein [Burkholderiaceae bacterium]
MAYLLFSPNDRAGALGFGLNQAPPAPKRTFNRTLDLAKLQAAADALVIDAEVPGTGTLHAHAGAAETDHEQVERLLMLGTSMGGARPKAVVEDDDALWVAKFNRPDDPWNSARVEHAMLKLARSCGLATAESRVVEVAGRDVLLVKRFDRERSPDGYRRARMVSALTLLRAEDTYRSRDKWSYVLLAEELRRVCADPARNAEELFRRMCFNALISNIDDHPRNHAVIAWGQDWQLSPAYDLTPATPVSQERRDLAMACGDRGALRMRPTCSLKQRVSCSNRFGPRRSCRPSKNRFGRPGMRRRAMPGCRSVTASASRRRSRIRASGALRVERWASVERCLDIDTGHGFAAG